MQTHRHGVAAVVLFTLGLICRCQVAFGHDDLALKMLSEGDPSRADWFDSLQTNRGVPCCDQRDCRRVEAEWRKSTKGWWILVHSEWRRVPDEVVLKSPHSIDGDAYVCMGEDSYGDTRHAISGLKGPLPGQIFCFVPPDLGF